MSPTPPRLHGKAKIRDPNLVKKICPKCKQRREWIITRKKEGGYIKKCKTCGIEIHVKAPKSKQSKSKSQK